MFASVASDVSPGSPSRLRGLKPEDRRDLARVLHEAREAHRLYEALHRKNGFRVATADGQAVALGGLPLAVLVTMGELFVRRKVSAFPVTLLESRLRRPRTSLNDALMTLSEYGFVERVGSGARFGLTTVGIAALQDWALYFAREKLIEAARRNGRPW
jgi:hypothetical protein